MVTFKDNWHYAALFLGAFFLLLGYFLGDPQLQHHEYVRLIHQNFKGCENWNCYKFGVSDYNLRGYIFIKYIFHKTLSFFGINNALYSSWALTSFSGAFFVTAIYYSCRLSRFSHKKTVITFLGIFILFPLLTKQVLIAEDNISYYGLIILYFSFCFNQKYFDFLYSLKCGAFLGLALLLHVSPLIFLFQFVLIPFYYYKKDDSWKSILTTLTFSVTIYFVSWIFLNLHEPLGDVFYTLKNSPLIHHLSMALTMTKGAVAGESSWVSQLLYGFDEMADHFSERGHTIFLSLLAMILISGLAFFSGLKKKNGLYLITIGILSISPVLFFEPQVGERWDFYLLFLITFFISYADFYNRTLRKILLITVLIQAPNSAAFFFSESEFSVYKKQLMIKYRKMEIDKTKEVFYFDLKYLNIEPIILSHFPGNEKNIYFINEKGVVYLSYMSAVAAGLKDEKRIWEYPILKNWHLNSYSEKPIAAFVVSPKCEMLSRAFYSSKELERRLESHCLSSDTN